MNERIRLRESCNANKQNNICVCAERVHVLFSLSSGLWRNISSARFHDKGQVSCTGCDADATAGSEDYLHSQHKVSWSQHKVSWSRSHVCNEQQVPAYQKMHEFVAVFFCWNSLKTWPEMQPSCSGVSICLSDKQHVSLKCPVFMCVVLFRTEFSFIGKS